MHQSDVSRRYAASWVDHLTATIERLPGPWWAPYLIAFGVLLVVANGAAWFDGTLALGSLDAYLSSLAVYPVAAVGAIHYLDGEASNALDRLRPALPIDDKAIESLRYRLTTLPADQGLAWSALGLAIALAYAAFGPSTPDHVASATVRAIDIAIALVGTPLLAVLFFHIVRQLRSISAIQRQIRRIDVFDLRPLHAFSGVTARSGLIILMLAYVGIATDPSTFVVVAVAVAIAAFVVPLLGTQRRIAAEKERVTAETNHDLHLVLTEISRRIRAGDLADADALNKQLDSLVTRRDLVLRISTWPWDAGTLRAFATAVLVPIGLWLVFRLLERLLG